ncbi:ImmA/IrrE family metallo-endopeptidase [Rhodopseudomonas sp.]|uniref:ImmA/IrrE family metallo-endopeptidase n=1 Tax=Rhodopseudomonas sp. TaxID=1078 RepID=UPI0039E5AE6A
MKITRMDLADKGSPEAIVAEILKVESDLAVPVPIEDLSRHLDIIDIAALTTDGFEGGLLTDRERSNGIVLVKTGVSRQRRRFTIGHELGHFLMPSHVPNDDRGFLCAAADLACFDPRETDRRKRMEVDANRFSSLILMPPPTLNRDLARTSDPSIENMLLLAKKYDVSKEAMARAYSNYHHEAVAFVVVRDGKVVRVYRNERTFPFVTAARGRAVPERSLFYRRGHRVGTPSDVLSCFPDLWIDVERGRKAPLLCEQICLQANGFALIMLWYQSEDDEDFDPDAERTAKDRLRERQGRRFTERTVGSGSNL